MMNGAQRSIRYLCLSGLLSLVILIFSAWFLLNIISSSKYEASPWSISTHKYPSNLTRVTQSHEYVNNNDSHSPESPARQIPNKSENNTNLNLILPEVPNADYYTQSVKGVKSYENVNKTDNSYVKTETSPNLEPVLDSNKFTVNASEEPIVSNDDTRLENCGEDTRPLRTIRLRNDLWHMDSFSGIGEVMVFSAYYDDRECFEGKAFIRLLVVTSITSNDNLLCQVWYGQLAKPLISQAKSENTGRGLNHDRTHYQERLYSCEVPNTRYPPLYVSMQIEKCRKSSMLVPVEMPERTQVHDIGVCVAIAYGTLDPIPLVEWVELNLILGVGEINVYDSHINAEARSVFQYYSERGVVRIHQAAPSVDDWCKWCQKLTCIAGLTDCMYRNMYRYKHMMVIDFDEVIIPKNAYTLQQLLTHVRNTWVTEPAAYSFRNTYFFLNSEPKYSTPSYLITTRYVNRQEPSNADYSPKSIINPRRCMVMQNHYCMKRTPDKTGSSQLNVKPEYALSHHYKICHFGKDQCTRLLNVTYVDETALRYKDNLNEMVRSALKGLGRLKPLTT